MTLIKISRVILGALFLTLPLSAASAQSTPLWCVEDGGNDTYALRFKDYTRIRTHSCGGSWVASSISGDYGHIAHLGHDQSISALINGRWQTIANNCGAASPQIIACPLEVDPEPGYYTFQESGQGPGLCGTWANGSADDPGVHEILRRWNPTQVCLPGADNLSGICHHLGLECAEVFDWQGTHHGCNVGDRRDRTQVVRCRNPH